MTMDDGTVMTVPADVESQLSNAAYTTMDSATPTIEAQAEATKTASVQDSDPTSESIYKRSAFQINLLTISSAVPQVTAAPSIDIRAADPEPASTAHSAFRLRARNPFIWLGWKQDTDETRPTPTLHL